MRFTKSQVTSTYNQASISPKKVAPVMNLVRGKNLRSAKIILAFNPTKAAKLVLKTLKSAEANAKNNSKLSIEDLYVSELFVSGGQVRHWGRAGSRGHHLPILKRSSHIYVGLNERTK